MIAIQDAPSAEPPHVEERLSLKYAGLRMPAALTLPREGEPKSAVLLVPGSLFVDVDGSLPFMDAWPHHTADLARQLAARGHAVLRYAKPGPGTGTEEVDAEAAKAHGRFLTRVDVARTGLDTRLDRDGLRYITHIDAVDPAVADALAEWVDRTATVGRPGAQ